MAAKFEKIEDELHNTFASLNEPKVRTFVLEQIQQRYNITIPSYLYNSLRVDTYHDYMMDNFCIAVTGLLTQNKSTTEKNKIVEKIVDKIEEYPSTIIDYFKLKYFPKWLLDKYPVNYTTYEKTTTIIHKEVTNNVKVFPEITLNHKNELLRIMEL